MGWYVRRLGWSAGRGGGACRADRVRPARLEQSMGGRALLAKV